MLYYSIAASSADSNSAEEQGEQHQPSTSNQKSEDRRMLQSHTDQTALDIDLAADSRSLSDGERLTLMENKWTVPEGFQWPYSERLDRGQIRRKYLGPQHLSGQYSCFSYSLAKQGVFCKPCMCTLCTRQCRRCQIRPACEIAVAEVQPPHWRWRLSHKSSKERFPRGLFEQSNIIHRNDAHWIR